MSADCGKLKNSNCFRRTHKGDFPKFSHIYIDELRDTLACETQKTNQKCVKTKLSVR